MSVSNGQTANATTFNNAFVSKNTDSTVNADIILSSGKWIYIGGKNAAGSMRLGVFDGEPVIQIYSGSSYITVWSANND